jgi:hypothetical protein
MQEEIATFIEFENLIQVPGFGDGIIWGDLLLSCARWEQTRKQSCKFIQQK